MQRLTPTAGPVRGGTPLTITGLRLAASGWADTTTVALALLGPPNAAHDGAVRHLVGSALPGAVGSSEADRGLGNATDGRRGAVLGSATYVLQLNVTHLDARDGTWLTTTPTVAPPASCAALCCEWRAVPSSAVRVVPGAPRVGAMCGSFAFASTTDTQDDSSPFAEEGSSTGGWADGEVGSGDLDPTLEPEAPPEGTAPFSGGGDGDVGSGGGASDACATCAVRLVLALNGLDYEVNKHGYGWWPCMVPT